MDRNAPGPRMLGRWLDTTMANRGLTNRALAKEVHVHESAVHNWRKGKNIPQMSTLQAIARILDVDPVRLAVTAGLWDPDIAQPLPTPEPVAKRAKARRRAQELLDELATLTEEIRDGEDGDQSTIEDKTLDALSAIRALILEGDHR